MLTDREVSAAVGTTAYDAQGDKIGTVEHFYVDDRSGTPSWVAVITGLFGTGTSIVPVQSATYTDGRLDLPVTRDSVRSAPDVGAGGHLGPDDESRLRQHYGLDAAGTGEPAWTGGETGPNPAGAAAAGAAPTGAAPRPDAVAAPAEAGMVRSEERLRVGTEQVAARRVRLVKYVVTEEVQITVPVRREEIRVEEVPLDAPDPGPGESLVPAREAGAAGSPGSAGLPEEIVLHTERPVVSVEVVPSERVRLRTELVQGQEQVSAQLQREQIVVDQDSVPRRG
jgi:stress response protein YsnF